MIERERESRNESVKETNGVNEIYLQAHRMCSVLIVHFVLNTFSKWFSVCDDDDDGGCYADDMFVL